MLLKTFLRLGPFVLNYIANIIKAQNNFGASTSLETFERKLLRGENFLNVVGIEKTGLQEMYSMLKSGKFNTEVYEPRSVVEADSTPDEKDLLLAEKRKKERALTRLKNLYLYNDNELPETEYFIERKALMDELEQIDNRLEAIELNSSSMLSISDDDFMTKASFFIMSQQLLTKRFINFESFIQKIDSKIVKDFINSIVKKIVILDGKIVSILFKNGIEHKFLYE